ncbi:MAG: hypothetical protein U1E42_10205 [Rhodospirillales bacterium]
MGISWFRVAVLASVLGSVGLIDPTVAQAQGGQSSPPTAAPPVPTPAPSPTAPLTENRNKERVTPQRRPEQPPPTGAQDGEPAMAAECAWIGKRIVSLLVRDDAMAAGDFLPFYLRFHCPEERIGKTFGCVVRNGEATPERVELCWADPSIVIPKPPKEPAAESPSAPAKPANPGGN